MSQESRYVVGIDLGTTNSALAYVDTGAGAEESATIHVLPIPQLTDPGEAKEQPLLPSFTYMPGAHELPAGSLTLPWIEDRFYVVGALAKKLGEKIPRRLVASAKSWLCHQEVDRTSPILPWNGEEDIDKISPLEATRRYLLHLKEAWNCRVAGEVDEYRLETQEVLLTVPASFDAVARELTAQAAAAAGLQRVTLLEEPQAAFYSWLEKLGDDWRNQVKVGDVILVCDIGGGTSDFSLIGVGEEEGNLTLERLAVGDHILLGGDNMDLALAHFAKAKLEEKGHQLDLAQLTALCHACRAAKEAILADPQAGSQSVTVVGRGSRLVGGTLQTDLAPEEVQQVVLEGFFPQCAASDRPARARGTGLRELGLHYASDPAAPKHIAAFLGNHGGALPVTKETKKHSFLHPSAILFNGGVLKASAVQERLLETLNSWLAAESGEPVRILEGADLDLAVARGAAYYGLVRRGQGIRIRGGTALTYYIGVETAMPAVPGIKPPIKALCVVPFGTEEGTDLQMTDQEFNLVVGEPAEFRFLGSTHRKEDAAGTIIDDWQAQPIHELAPLEATLTAEGQEGNVLPVRLQCRVTEVGTLELWFVSRDEANKWKLEFNVRESAR